MGELRKATGALAQGNQRLRWRSGRGVPCLQILLELLAQALRALRIPMLQFAQHRLLDATRS